MGRQAALIALFLAGCASAPFGEIVVQVDTDVSVPELGGRLRLDLYALDGTWYESREIATTSASEWPLSFSLFTDDPAGKSARMRLRLFADGAVRDYRGEQPPGPPPFTPPPIATTLDGLCKNAPLLPPYTELTQRRGSSLVTQHTPQADCVYMSAAGSVAARVDIAATDTYRFEVVRAKPDGAHGVVGGDTILFLRRACADPSTQIACNDEVDFAAQSYLSRLELTLDPGTYYLITGGKPEASPADLTLRWAPTASWSLQPASSPPTPTEASPRLVVDGVDATPDTEPLPGRSIDRLLDVHIDYGARTSIGVVLAGECLGTPADLFAGTSCVGQSGARQASEFSAPTSETRAGSWSALSKAPCVTLPRTGDPDLFDGQICIPGGTFTLGTDELDGVGELDPSPRQVAIVAPFLIDQHEVTVGRYRKALADGYAPPSTADFDQIANDGPLIRSDPRIGCTWNGDASGPAAGVDRERYPLNCISWRNARALCEFFGGDLPTSVQWEYAATASVGQKTRYPWGDEAPDCARAVFGRGGGGCTGDAPGPEPVDAAPWGDADRTPLGVAGLGGGVAEWVRDAFRPYRDACWWQRPLRDVGCAEDDPPERMMRGGAWNDVAQSMPSALIIGQAPEFPGSVMGLRCVYRSAP